MEISVVYENSEICIINKPQGLSVQGGEGVSKSVDNLLCEQLGQKIYLVHRLDKETSGLLITAKSKEAASKWTSLIAGKHIKKEYCAICFGIPVINGKKTMSGTISGTLLQRGEEKSAVTHFTVEKTAVAKGEDGNELELSFLRLTLGTGRMHQLRIQLASVGSPIAGDDKHGDFKKNRLAKKLCSIKRLCLCACRLTSDDPSLFPENSEGFSIDLPEHIAIVKEKFFSN